LVRARRARRRRDGARRTDADSTGGLRRHPPRDPALRHHATELDFFSRIITHNMALQAHPVSRGSGALIPLNALRGRHLFVAFFLIGLVPRLLVFNIALHRERPVYTWQDSPGYIMMAHHLADGNGFRDEGGP